MNKRSLTAGRPTDYSGSRAKERAIEIARQTSSYLDGPTVSSRYDLNRKVKRALDSLSKNTFSNDVAGDKERAVTARMLVTEALEDLFKKYEDGKGRYPFQDEHDWNGLK